MNSEMEEECKNCMNCRDYGVWENNILVCPCLNHAKDCNYYWQGRRCLGAKNGLFEISAEELAEYVYSARIVDNYKSTETFAKQNRQSVYNFCKKELPTESHFHFNKVFWDYKDRELLASYGHQFFILCMQDVPVHRNKHDTCSVTSSSEFPRVDIEYSETKSNKDLISRKFEEAYRRGDVIDLTK